jgi:VWFA-related protein
MAGIENVEVDVVVTTRKGDVVHDLTERDFQVFEEGKPQAVTTFARVDIPIDRPENRTAARSASIESDVTTNERTIEGRVYVLVMDELHISGRSLATAKQAARAFIDRLGTNDLMAVVHTAGVDAASQEFTTSRRRLREAVDQTTAHGLESATVVRNQTAIASGGRRIEDTFDLERAQNADTTLRVLHNVASWFETVHGRRKAILLVSEGIDYAMAMNDRPAEPNSPWDVVLQNARDAVGAAMRSNLSIYAFDPNRMSGVDDLATEYFAPRSSAIGPRGAQRELRSTEDNLRWLSDETGGLAIIGRNDFESAYDRIVADNSTYYVLGYVPPAHKRDGKFHKISVRVGRPGVTIRTRSGYLSPKGDAPQRAAGGPSTELRTALATPLPVGGIPIRLSLAPFKGTSARASVLMTEDLLGGSLALDRGNTVELSYVAVDVHGNVSASSNDRLALTMVDADTKAQIQRSGLRVLNRIDLPPGRYSLRIAARDQMGAATGSIGYDLDVPDFDNVPLALSGMVLTSLTTRRFVVAKADPQLQAVLPAPPITERTFSRGSEVWLFAEVYDNLGETPHRTAITTTLASDTGTVVYSSTSDHDPADFHGQHGTFRYRLRVPLSDLAPGRYVISIEAKTHEGPAETATREVPITVVE